MNVGNDCVVSIEYRLSSDTGEVLDESEEGKPLSFVFGRGQMVAGLENALLGMEAGQRVSVVVEPSDGYGLVSDELFRELPRDAFPSDLDVVPGLRFSADGPHGTIMLRVCSVRDDTITVDLNHPLAGQRLCFDVLVVACREASEEEIANVEAACSPSDCARCCGGCH